VYDSALGPISFPNVCADSQTAADQVTCFSNGGSALDLLAPGALITSTGRGGGTSTYLGTSQASPHAAGAAALLLQQTASLTPDQIEARLKSTGVVLTDPRSGLTAARIHVAAALGQGPTPQPPPPPVDRSAPTARALPGTYKPGASTRLLFTMADDSGEARSVVTVRAASGRVLKTYRSGFRATASGSVYSYTWRAPASTKGTLRHCVEAFDRAGNAGKRSCAPIRRR
jgi:subtilisin family serine protease